MFFCALLYNSNQQDKFRSIIKIVFAKTSLPTSNVFGQTKEVMTIILQQEE